jgi:hypothetical protein
VSRKKVRKTSPNQPTTVVASVPSLLPLCCGLGGVAAPALSVLAGSRRAGAAAPVGTACTSQIFSNIGDASPTSSLPSPDARRFFLLPHGLLITLPCLLSSIAFLFAAPLQSGLGEEVLSFGVRSPEGFFENFPMWKLSCTSLNLSGNTIGQDFISFDSRVPMPDAHSARRDLFAKIKGASWVNTWVKISSASTHTSRCQTTPSNTMALRSTAATSRKSMASSAPKTSPTDGKLQGGRARHRT